MQMYTRERYMHVPDALDRRDPPYPTACMTKPRNLEWHMRTDAEDRLLLVDDVFDSGLSMQAVVQELGKKARKNTPSSIRIATPYFKPVNNQSDLVPDYFLHETDKWLIFPHELEGLSREEIYENKPCLKKIMEGIQEP